VSSPRHIRFCLTLALAACQSAAARKENWYAPAPAADFRALAARSGKPLWLHDQRGSVVLLSFGYTSCADICPFTLGTMGLVLGRLGRDAARTRAFYATFDPERDTIEHMRDFLVHFDPRVEGLVIADGALGRVLNGYDVVATRRAPNLRRYNSGHAEAELDYSFDHTAAFWLVDGRGQLRVRYADDASADAIVAGVRKLLHE
jgi:protein SCO1/2